MKETQHPFLVSLHALEKKIEQLTRELKIQHIQDPEIMLLDNADLYRCLRSVLKQPNTGGKKD